MKVAVMIPTYNEKYNIARVIKGVFNSRRKLDLHILEVDDNSPDGTGEIAKKLANGNSRIHVLIRKGKRGRGLAGIDGFKYCLKMNADYVVEMDADLSHDPKYVPALVEAAKDADIVLGSRYIKGGKDLRSWKRKLLSILAHVYIRFLTGMKVSDCTTGYRCWRRKALEAIVGDLTAEGPFIVTDSLYKAYRKGFSVKEIPIDFEDRKIGLTKLNFGIVLDNIMKILKIRMSAR